VSASAEWGSGRSGVIRVGPGTHEAILMGLAKVSIGDEQANGGPVGGCARL